MDGLYYFITGLTWQSAIAYFWPFFLLDMMRYLIIEAVVVVRYRIYKRQQRSTYRVARRQLFTQRPLVSVIVPGKNEGKHIAKLIATLAQQTYLHYELIVVDDGSDDATAHLCRRLQAQGKIDTFIRNEVRGGKASGANTALQHCRGEFVVHLDADSHLAHDALEHILLPFLVDAKVGAVGGDVRVANADATIPTRLQAIEYMKTISSSRVVSTQLNILRIISGAHGAFRRDVLAQVNGWDVGPGLDGDLTLKIRKLGYRVVHEVDAVCYTNVPLSLNRLARQRYRWDRSLVRFRLRKHVDILKPQANFRGSNFISVIENILFNVIFDVKWFVYIGYLFVTSPQYLGYIFVINYVLYLLANILQYLIARLVMSDSWRTLDAQLPLFLPLMPLYTGLYLRFVRTYAYLMEALHRTSYDDPWNPWKVSKIAKAKKL
jgi:cellulose synthase/poly-beta-1,6-N-acetylglucosamine synthase-like glycosyltransferase